MHHRTYAAYKQIRFIILTRCRSLEHLFPLSVTQCKYHTLVREVHHVCHSMAIAYSGQRGASCPSLNVNITLWSERYIMSVTQCKYHTLVSEVYHVRHSMSISYSGQRGVSCPSLNVNIILWSESCIMSVTQCQ